VNNVTDPKSVFVEEASAQVAATEPVAGDPVATRMLAEARAHIYYWPADFRGFRSRIEVVEGTSSFVGSLEAPSSRKFQIQLEGFPRDKWLRFQIEELVAHRESPAVSKMVLQTGCELGDFDQVYGQQVLLLGDKMQSFYRLRDQKLTQIGRVFRGQRLLINIDEHLDCGGKFASTHYTAFYWELDGRLAKCETYLDRYALVGSHYLPEERRYSLADGQGLRSCSIRFQESQLL
jgi:hypothetical protein